MEHWGAIKAILKYLWRTRDFMLVYSRRDLFLVGYIDVDVQSDRDDGFSTSGAIFILGGASITWTSNKQKCIAGSTLEAGMWPLLRHLKMQFGSVNFWIVWRWFQRVISQQLSIQTV